MRDTDMMATIEPQAFCFVQIQRESVMWIYRPPVQAFYSSAIARSRAKDGMFNHTSLTSWMLQFWWIAWRKLGTVSLSGSPYTPYLCIVIFRRFWRLAIVWQRWGQTVRSPDSSIAITFFISSISILSATSWSVTPHSRNFSNQAGAHCWDKRLVPWLYATR